MDPAMLFVDVSWIRSCLRGCFVNPAMFGGMYRGSFLFLRGYIVDPDAGWGMYHGSCHIPGDAMGIRPRCFEGCTGDPAIVWGCIMDPAVFFR